ncbi:MAG: ribonuclease Z [Aigarchaeota archaeon]|nr:ribonuclease Z [Aigarchaeota archaeon]MDW8092356.1 ribonuclease Z [Nitrososphaerota archaeon]
MTRMSVVFLGTSGGMPSKFRGMPSVGVKFSGSLILFDCGEGTCRQIVSAGLGFPTDFRVFLSHLHADHTLGLPGLIYTMSLLGREDPLHVYGPEGTRESVEYLLEGSRGEVGFEVAIHEIRRGVVYEERDFSIEAELGDHTVLNLCYKLRERDRPGKLDVDRLMALGVPQGPLWGTLQRGEPVIVGGRRIDPEGVVGPRRPGRVVIYTGDTRACRTVIDFCRGADLLIHDSTFGEDMKRKAVEDGHSTAGEAAYVAREAGVRRLYLTHISPRYEGREGELLTEARATFANSSIARDLEWVDVDYP